MSQDSPKLIAFYLPQFHPIQENDAWWGKGFTEWTNVTKARQLFAGHYQPRLPSDLGFYDLRVPEVREAQAELARKYGIHGFCYYYYFFDGGKQLLERPIKEVLESGKPDFPYCLCWANENWTRRWDGMENEVLMHQNHSLENNLAFIRSVIPYFQDSRYIRIEGRPLLAIYRATLFQNMPETISLWRDELARHGLPPPYLVAVESFEVTGEWAINSGFDAVCEFPPHNLPHDTYIDSALRQDNKNYIRYLVDYEKVVKASIGSAKSSFPRHRCVTLSWDNTPRKGREGLVMRNFSLKAYYHWLSVMRDETQRTFAGDQRLLFVNAWNEWGEGTYLEPDQLYGHAYLEATHAAMHGISFNESIPVEGHVKSQTKIGLGTKSEQSIISTETPLPPTNENVSAKSKEECNHRCRLVSISTVGNESDIVEAFVRENLRFVDYMLIADHNSCDGTQAILKNLTDEGLPIEVTRIGNVEFSQQTITDKLLARAIRECGADWVVPLDADEFLDVADRDKFEKDLTGLGHRHGKVAWLNHVPTEFDDTSETNPLRRISHVYAYPLVSPDTNPWVWKTIVNARLLGPYLDRYGLIKGNHFVSFSNSIKPSMQPTGILKNVRLHHYPSRSFEQLGLKTGLGMFNQLLSNGVNTVGAAHWERILNKILDGEQSFETMQFAVRQYLDAERFDSEDLASTPIVHDPYPVSCDLKYAYLRKPHLSTLLQWIKGGYSNEAGSNVPESLDPVKVELNGIKEANSIQPVWKTQLSSGADSFIEYYHDNPRHEIVEMIGKAPHALLDVGCAGGATVRLIKENFPKCHCVGIEPNTKAASLAATRVDRVIMADVEELNMPSEDLPEQGFDVIVMADVLEHLKNPWQVLEKCKSLLSGEGRIIASLPNVFNLQIFEGLAGGSWKYDKDGILDVTHLRFFTPRDMRAMFEETGYEIEVMKGIPHPKQTLPPSQRDGLFGVSMEHVQLSNIHPDLMRHLSDIQIVIVAKPSSNEKLH